jgi:hypothetical protein
MGREGVKRVKRLLEGTMRFQLPYDAYKNRERVVLPMLVEGQRKFYDLKGVCLDEGGQVGAEIYIESKAVSDAGQQGTEFKDFLARAYSATMRIKGDNGLDPKHEFMWATTCPWKGSGFRRVATRAELLDAVKKADDKIIPKDHNIDEAVVEAVANRLWVWVIAERHEEMIMGREMRAWVAAKIQENV